MAMPNATVGVFDTPPIAPALQILSANPVRGPLVLQLELSTIAGTDPIVLEVFNVRGQKVRTLYEGKGGEDLGINWDLQDQNGRRASGGIYFLTLSGAGTRVTKRVLILP